MEVRGQEPSLCYRFIIENDLDPNWLRWFDGFDVTALEDGTTLLEGDVKDQAELHGILLKFRNFGLSLVSLQRMKGRLNPDVRFQVDE